MEKPSKEQLQTMFEQIRQENEGDDIVIQELNDYYYLIFSGEYEQLFLFVFEKESTDGETLRLTIFNLSRENRKDYDVSLSELSANSLGENKRRIAKRYIEAFMENQI